MYGSAGRRSMFSLVMEVVSMKDIPQKLLFADDLAIVPESEQEMQEEWKEAFEKHGLKMSLAKPEVMGVGTAERQIEHQVRGEGDKTGK